MNREEKRKTMKSFTAKGYTAKQTERLLMIKSVVASKKFLKEGDRVKINIPQMQSRPEWKSNVDQNKSQFQAWVLDHRDEVLTVEYDKNHTKDPVIVCLKEDDTDPKWMFWEGDLDAAD